MSKDEKQRELKRYHGYLLEMLSAFDAFCTEHKIEYFLAGGSALGAVRHKGLIPWDDDIDLAMMRPEFERLERILAEQENKIGRYDYSPVIGQIVPDAPIGHVLYLPEGTYDPADAPKLDVHPIDGLPKASWKRKVQYFFSIVHYMAVYRHPTKNKGKAARWISSILVRTTTDKMFDFYAKVSRKIIAAQDPMRSKQVCSLFGLAGYANEVMDRDILLPYQRVEFEGHIFPIPGKEKEYLTQLYGDYMKLPPESERMPKHDGYARFIQGIEA